MTGKRLVVAFAVGALAALGAASAASAAPKPTPSPTPPPVVKPPSPVVPSGPTPVANGASGADLVEATGEQVTPPAPPTTSTVTPPPPVATVPTVTPSPPVTTPVPGPSPAVARSAQPVLPRDGAIVLAGVLVIGLAVALRAIRARERRIGFALLAFCLAYLVVLAGLVSGVAGA